MTKPVDPADLSGAAPASAQDAPDPDAIPFTAVPLRPRPIGWTAYRQRRFIEALGETGSVSAAAEEAGASVRSAYRLRLRPDGQSFAAAWNQAQQLGARRLLDCAIERATIGQRRGVWRDGRKIGEEIVASDRLLIFLLGHLQPTRFGKLSGLIPVKIPDAVEEAEKALPPIVERLADMSLPKKPDVHESFDVLWEEDYGDDPAPAA